MKKIIVLLIGSLLISSNNNSSVRDNITEEATPIRVEDKIKALDYQITINKSNRKKIIYNTQILESINHYLDVSDIDDFFINFKINNNTKEKYYLKRIIIFDHEDIIKAYNYNKLIKNNKFSVKLSKKIFDKTIKNNDVIGKIEIIIEK